MEDEDVGYKTQIFLSQVPLILEGHRKSTFFFHFFIILFIVSNLISVLCEFSYYLFFF